MSTPSPLRSRLPNRLLATVLALTWALGSASPRASGLPSAADDSAVCIAVMQQQADGLARRAKAGDKDAEPALKAELRLAAALIGRVYLDGAHDEEQAKARLKQAHEAQAGWTDEHRRSVHQGCVQRADSELASATAAQRFVVDRIAQARLKRMLDAH